MGNASHGRIGLDASELGALDDAVEAYGELGATLRARPVVVFPAENHAAQRTLCRVVLEREPGLFDEAAEP